MLPSAGSAANVRHLRYDLGVKFAIVQADVFQAFIDRAADKNVEAANIIRPLRVILPLYNTEIHYIVRADSELNYLHDIRNAKINGGLLGSGAALITHTLYRMMFGGPIPEANASYLSNEEALVKLVTDKSVDVVVVAAGQPAPLVANMKPEAQKLIKLLKFDPAHATSRLPLTTYTPATVRAEQLPQPPDRRLHDHLGRRLPGHLRLQPEGHGRLAVPVRTIVVQELCDAAGPGPPQVARGRPEAAGTRPGLDLLSAHDPGNTRVRRREIEGASEAGQEVLARREHTGALQVAFVTGQTGTAARPQPPNQIGSRLHPLLRSNRHVSEQSPTPEETHPPAGYPQDRAASRTRTATALACDRSGKVSFCLPPDRSERGRLR